MALTWAARRQTLYYVVFSLIGVFVVVVGYQIYFSGAPTCQDGVQNGIERGVDCGGACILICKQDAKDPVVLWSRAFKTSPGQYTVAAYVQNNNIGAGARRVGYTFQLFDEDNILVAQKDGTMDLPPTQGTPILETNINTGTRDVARTHFAFTNEISWQKVTAQPPQLRTTEQRLTVDGSRLSATLLNESLQDAPRVGVVAVLYDRAGVALAASRSTMSVAPKSSEFIVFTWQPPPAGVFKAEISILPPF